MSTAKAKKSASTPVPANDRPDYYFSLPEEAEYLDIPEIDGSTPQENLTGLWLLLGIVEKDVHRMVDAFENPMSEATRREAMRAAVFDVLRGLHRARSYVAMTSHAVEDEGLEAADRAKSAGLDAAQ
jgi:hypothetical protein